MKQEYGLLGHPLGHSFSRAFFNDKFAREGIDAEYLNFDLSDISELPQLLAEHPNLCGLNVTIPYKQAVIPYLDELSDEARAIGAVNVIKVLPPTAAVLPPTGGVREGPYLKGFNSDVIGFTESIRPLLEPHHKKALVLGTGGASKAVCAGLDKLGIEWRYVSRSGAGERLFTYSDLTPEIIAEYTVIVNCTPLGMYPRIDSCPEIPYRALSPRHLLFDLVYNPEITLFMRNGRRQGAKVKNGLEMLHLQALASWEFWTGEAPLAPQRGGIDN
ncbi:MAG: shikimate dehydrogenase [Bacteroidaceae bacterium]|nr:shikimate dehydrogenase [Bacteroidaceae bacterium]